MEVGSKTKCEYCGSTLCLRIKDEQGITKQFTCINCGKDFSPELPFGKAEELPGEMI